jgi:demethylmenaquinone methyltransferase/2-methoxy-6-polyprenyl-1,4-benzoquinol methylase
VRPRPNPLLDQLRTYYDERAPDYMDPSKPSDRKGRGGAPEDLVRLLVDEFAPTGDVLEIACGSGAFTREIVRHANAVTALDGSPRMIERNRQEVADPKVNYVVADAFTWEPDRAYDAAVFSFWLSHVPPDDRFDAFWSRVAAALNPGGRVCFIDEDDRAAVLEDLVTVDDVPVARRTLADGRGFDVVKVLWRPEDLENRLALLGWDIRVRPVGDVCLVGVGASLPQ